MSLFIGVARLKCITAFFIGMLAVLGLAVALPSPRDLRYARLTGDAQQLSHVYARIMKDPRPINVAFIGTSRTMNGVDDRGVELGLAKADQGGSVANLGVPWPGRDLELLIVQMLFAEKVPRLIVIELDQYEVPYGHVLMPYVADLPELVTHESYLNYKLIPSLLTLLRERVRGAIYLVWGESDAPLVAPSYTWVPNEEAWNERQRAISLEKAARETGLVGWLKQQYVRWASPFGLDAVSRIAKLAHDRGAEVAFLYLPARHYLKQDAAIENQGFYRMLGPIFRTPSTLQGEDGSWADWAHLSPRGAQQLVPRLVADIVSFRNPGQTEVSRFVPGSAIGDFGGGPR